MTVQNGFKIFLVSAAVACCISPAYGQEVLQELTGTVGSFQGGFGQSSDLGKSVTIDFSYDSGLVTQTPTSTGFIESSPITSAVLSSGPFGSGINLERNGPGSGLFSDNIDFVDQSFTVSASTSITAPGAHFTGDVYGFSYVSDAITSTLDLFRNVYNQGTLEGQSSGTVSLLNVSVGTPAAAPEMDPSSALGALTLLAGGLAIFSGRKMIKARAA